MKEKNPYRWLTLLHWLWYIRQPGHHCHRMFWAWGTIDGPVYWIYYLGIFSLVWNEIEGWSWGGWNFD